RQVAGAWTFPRDLYGDRGGRCKQRAAASPLPAHENCGGASRKAKPNEAKRLARAGGGGYFFFCSSPAADLARFPLSPLPGFRLVKCRLLQRSLTWYFVFIGFILRCKFIAALDNPQNHSTFKSDRLLG
ncbi:MAG: hypothetical protein QXX08_10885, partial [Candidatus Bathyarchaeia archaeon]